MKCPHCDKEITTQDLAGNRLAADQYVLSYLLRAMENLLSGEWHVREADIDIDPGPEDVQ